MAAGDRTETRLIGHSAVGTSNGTLGTVSASNVWVTKQIVITNTNGVDAWVSLAIGTSDTASNCFFYQLPIAGNDTLVFDTALVLTAAETIQGQADRSGVNITVNGWVKEV